MNEQKGHLSHLQVSCMV